MFYEKIIRPILFLFPPEIIHNFTFSILGIFNKNKILNKLLFKICYFSSPRLKQKLFGLNFVNPIGLTEGLDKNGKLSLTWPAFNFAWANLGSITYEAQAGNKKPRLWRLPKDKGLVVYYGLANLGAQKIVNKLQQDKNRFPQHGIWSISIAKTNTVLLEEAAEDYAKTFELIKNIADIITINLSCPNVKNFTGLQSPELLEPILLKITNLNTTNKPLWLKIGNDLKQTELDAIIFLVKKYKIAGVVATNLAKDKTNLKLKSPDQNKPGGISGLAIAQKANEIISYLYKNSENKYKIIGVGGVFSGNEAYAKIKAGANLVQIGTGFIYGGPLIVKKITKELDALLLQDNLSNVSQAVGTEADIYNLKNE